MGKKIRSRSIESVMTEVRFLVDTYGIDELYFEDDNFTIQRDRALEILERIAAFKPAIYLKFANGIRADMVDREILGAMKRAHVYSLSFGIESGCTATLTRMKKSLDLDKARQNILLAKSMGFLVGANCIIGYPGETVQDVEKSLDFFFSLPLDSMAIVNLVPFPGTEVREHCEGKGYLTKEARNWDKLIHKAYRRMYLRPRWLWHSLKRISLRQVVLGAAIMLGKHGRNKRGEMLRQ
jgi:radical SAM superfamily enzyme YgiQ (UPF0313 family)